MKHSSLAKIAALAIAVSAALPAMADTAVVAAGKHHYVYFGDRDIYFAPETKTYFWLENGRWQSGFNLPSDRQHWVTTARGVDIELDTDRPYERNDYVVEHYRHAPVAAAGPGTDTTTTERQVNADGSTVTTTTTTKHRYVYYGDREVYFAPDTRMYYWKSDGRWISGNTVPANLEPYVRSGGVQIELDTDRPYERNDYVVEHYRNRPVASAGPGSESRTERQVNADGSTVTTTTTTKHRYVYYGDREVYFAPDTRLYYWKSNGRWISGNAVPADLEPFVRSGGVQIELDTDRPYERNEYVIAHYGHRHDRDRNHDRDDD